jgi:cation diffusion facilitator family transporter
MSSSRKSIYAGILSNVAIAIAKVVGFFFTRSSAMLSEAIHSFVDCGNGILLLVGQRQAARPADETHPFGYGKELYFWSLIVALLIFFLGGGISVIEGIDHVRHPGPAQDPIWSYAILGFAFCFEAYALRVGIGEFREANPGRPILQAIHASKDPSGFTTIFEDTAALLGLVIAFLGIFVSHTFAIPQADGLASILIGLLLLAVAVLLIAESKALLVGEGADLTTLRAIRTLVQADTDVDKAGYPFTMYFGPHTVLLTMNVQFKRDLPGFAIEASVDRIEAAIRGSFPDINRIYLEVDSIRTERSTEAIFPVTGAER